MEASKVSFCSSYSFDSSLLFILFRCLSAVPPFALRTYFAFDVLFLNIDPNTTPYSLYSGLCTSSKLSLIEDSTFRYIAAYSATSQHSSAMLSPRLILFWLFAAFHVANALNPSVPYEAVYFYNAYKIEFAATMANPALRTIATQCVHNAVGAPAGSPSGIVEQAFIDSTIAAEVPGICSFDDFLRGRNNRGIADIGWRAFRPPAPTVANPTSLTITLEPDADALAAAVLNPNTLGANRLGFLVQRLLSAPVLATYVTAAGAYPYARTISKVSDAVQRARLAVAGGTVVLSIMYV